MGLFHVKVKIAAHYPVPPAFSEDLDALVDTGATFTTIPRPVLLRLGVAVVGRTTVRLADGSIREKDHGIAVVQVDGRIVGSSILFGDEGDMTILGATTLELACLAVDPVQQRLVPIQAIQA